MLSYNFLESKNIMVIKYIILLCITSILVCQIPFSESQKIKSQLFMREGIMRQDSKPELSTRKFEKKSVAKAFFSSLLLPGLGESYLGHKNHLKFFFSVETLCWGIYAANRLKVKWKKEDYKNFAVQHASIDQSGKNDQYWIDISFSDNIYNHNEKKRRERYIDAIYIENVFNYWQWDSQENRFYYDRMRVESRKIERRDVYIIGGIVLNHIISAINALRLARKYNRKMKDLSWNLDFQMDTPEGTAILSFVKRF
jgi:hypothetical protein